MPVDEYIALERNDQERYLETLLPDELLQFGIRLYNAGYFWHAHEAWEQVWMDAPRELRAFYQGLIQVTAAFVHLTKGEYPGTVRLLEAGIDKLAAYPGSFMGIELGKLVERARAAREQVVALGERRVGQFERSWIPRIELSQSSSWRGR